MRRCIAPQVGNDMAVGVHRQPDLGVPQEVHHDPGRDALHQEQASRKSGAGRGIVAAPAQLDPAAGGIP